MSDTLKAQVASLKVGIAALAAEAERLRTTLAVVEADRDNMARELETIEKFLRQEGAA